MGAVSDSSTCHSPGRRRAVAMGLLAGAAPLVAGHAFASAVVRAWPAARPVPGLDLADLDGHHWQLSGLAGKVALLNFWATWCEPCRAEIPSLDALLRQQRSRGLVILAINYRETATVIRGFLQRTPYRATVLLDADGDAASDWTPRVFPTTVLIDRAGRPVSTVLGDLDWRGAQARELLDPLLDGGVHA